MTFHISYFIFVAPGGMLSCSYLIFDGWIEGFYIQPNQPLGYNISYFIHASYYIFAAKNMKLLF